MQGPGDLEPLLLCRRLAQGLGQLQGRGALGQLLVVHRDVVREHPRVARARVQGVRGLVPDAVGFLGRGRVAL